VPVWEQCRRWDGALYAEECAARDGLHLRVPYTPACLHGATVLHEMCACGDPSPRIVAVDARAQRAFARQAAEPGFRNPHRTLSCTGTRHAGWLGTPQTPAHPTT
jgi:hypothetical protein